MALIDAAHEAESAREYLRAQALYEQAKEAAPDAPSRAVAARAYGRALIFYGEYDRAEKELSEAARLQPDDPGTWHDVGMVRHRLGDDPGAERAFREAIHRAPRDGRPRLALAALLTKQTRFVEALDEYRQLARLDLPERVRASVAWAIQALEGELERTPAAP